MSLGWLTTGPSNVVVIIPIIIFIGIDYMARRPCQEARSVRRKAHREYCT